MSTQSVATPTPPVVAEAKKIFGRYTLMIGVLLLLLGFAGFFLPGAISLATDVIIASLLIVGGVFWGFHGISDNPKNLFNWLKPILLVGAGVIMLLFPATSIEALALWLAAYLLLDMTSSFIIAIRSRPASGWGWMMFNGMVSLLLAVMILGNWPGISLWIVGVYVSISLMFDGIALLAIRSAVQEALDSTPTDTAGSASA
jgi:uncharacterized membrane protein HdeD (DUF308 family)